jgi:GDPmannose 4,6-dehydratase
LKKAFITGLTGQDGSYLAEFLLKKNYIVHGIIRRNSVFTTKRIDHLLKNSNFKIYHGDLTDSSNLHNLLSKIKPDEVYNLGAQSHVGISFEVPEYTAAVDAFGVLRLLNAIKDLKYKPRLYQASTSELFGGLPKTCPQSEKTQFYPKSPYSTAKLYAYWTIVNYREAYDLFLCNGILFNHESPRRGETFVTKKITKAVARISQGRQKLLRLGNLNAKRDWGYAKDYVESMWLMLQQKKPDDYIIATGKSYTVRQFVEWAFEEVNIKLRWQGIGINEKGIDASTGKVLVVIDAHYFRPLEVDFLLGDSSKARRHLGWKPKVNIRNLIHKMVKYDLQYDDYGGNEE